MWPHHINHNPLVVLSDGLLSDGLLSSADCLSLTRHHLRPCRPLVFCEVFTFHCFESSTKPLQTVHRSNPKRFACMASVHGVGEGILIFSIRSVCKADSHISHTSLCWHCHRFSAGRSCPLSATADQQAYDIRFQHWLASLGVKPTLHRMHRLLQNNIHPDGCVSAI